ncbi:MAG: hypothetical protein SGBAC_009711 [Bacillariaceae sp.]
MSTPVSISDPSSVCGFTWPGLPGKPSLDENRRWGAGDGDFEEAMLAGVGEGMKHLTFQDIQEEQEVLHGVAGDVVINENIMNDLLLSLTAQLDRLKKGSAYETAARRNGQAYAANRELQTAFLRANRFDPKESAEKMIKFFKYKQELFGEESLERDITAEDLDGDDVKCLLEGYFQYSPFRDRSGRKIHLEFPGVRTKTTIRAELRARFYVLANTVETLVDVSKGTILVTYLVHQYQDHLNGAGFMESLDFMMATIPLTMAGNHLCISARLECMICNACVAMMPHRDRVKTKIHFGSHVECQYLLASYGVTRSVLPLRGANNDMDLTYWNTWFQQRKMQEQQRQPGSPIYSPLYNPSTESATAQSSNTFTCSSSSTPRTANENDVLCLGRVVKGVGNERLHSLALLYETQYLNGRVADRRHIADGIINEIHRHGGRFLRPDTALALARTNPMSTDEQQLKELSPKERRSKVMQLFRNLRRRQTRSVGASTVSPSAVAVSVLPPLVPSETLASSDIPAQSSIFVDAPMPADVILGQRSENPGNKLLRDLVGSLAEEYNRTGRGEKKNITLQLTNTIHESGGRFLKPTDDGRWEVASDEVAREKISKHFCNIRRKR